MGVYRDSRVLAGIAGLAAVGLLICSFCTFL